MTLKLLAIGGLGNMLGPSAKHLTNSHTAHYIRVLDRGAHGKQKDELRQDWQQHGAQLVSNLTDLIGDGDFDGVVICAGKNADDHAIFRALIPLLNHQRAYFILHLSTVSCGFVQATQTYCEKNHVQYVNYPLTGGAKGALTASMLVLCGGDKKLYDRLEPMLQQIGKPKYFGERVDLAAGVKLIGHVMVFHGLLGMSLAVSLQKQLFGFTTIDKAQVEFFDFLNQGAGGTKQWDFAVRPLVLENNFSQGFLIQHAVIDIIYTVQLMRQEQLPNLFVLALLEVALSFAYVLNHYPEKNLTTQAVTHLIANKPKEIDQFLKQNLSLDIDRCLENCIAVLPEEIQRTLMLEVNY
jgi:3-hydroxyisobutyrate dehydrogenase-like beta-hydroxyacid dehydrogenase